MPASNAARRSRPILAGGEQLRQEVERPQSGGPKYDPVSLEEAKAGLLPQFNTLREAALALPDELRGERIIVQATLLPNYLANSYFPELLLSFADLIPVGTRAGKARYQTPKTAIEDAPTKQLYLAATPRSFERLGQLLEGRAETRTASAAELQLPRISSLRLPEAHDVIVPWAALDIGEVWEAVLHPEYFGAATRSEAGPVFRKWVQLVARLGGSVNEDYRRVVGGLTFVPVRLVADVVPEAARFNPLRAIRPMPKLRPIIPGVLRAVAAPMPDVPAFELTARAARVAIFDGGVDGTSPYFRPYVTTIDATTEPTSPTLIEHGTMVTSLALFGQVMSGEPLPAPQARVDHHRVLPVPAAEAADIELYWVLDRIREAIEAHEYEIVNLSLGPDLAVAQDDEPHRWTAELDELADERSVLFVAAVGNNGEADATLQLNRIQVPSDMVNGLGIGACNVAFPVSPWSRAPYSAVGPGRAGARIRPSGLAFGGVPANQARGLAPTGLQEGCGTSFAAPVVVRGLSQLFSSLSDERRTANNARAFAIHFAEQSDLALAEGGYGRLPSDYAEWFECPAEAVTVLYQTQIERNETISLPLPLPIGLANGMIDLRWTLVAATSVDPTDAVEYCKQGIDIHFRPHASVLSYVDPATMQQRQIDSDKDRVRFQQLLRSGVVFSVHPVSKSVAVMRSELQRRDDGKWETVRHARTRYQAKSLKSPRLDLSFLSREGGALTGTGVPPLPFSLLVTLRTKAGSNLYDRVTAAFPMLTALPVRIQPQVST